MICRCNHCLSYGAVRVTIRKDGLVRHLPPKGWTTGLACKGGGYGKVTWYCPRCSGLPDLAERRRAQESEKNIVKPVDDPGR